MTAAFGSGHCRTSTAHPLPAFSARRRTLAFARRLLDSHELVPTDARARGRGPFEPGRASRRVNPSPAACAIFDARASRSARTSGELRSFVQFLRFHLTRTFAL